MTSCLRIIVQAGPGAGETFVLQPGDRAVAGRAPECRIAIPDNGLSRRHLELTWDGTHCKLFDLGSTNGTLANGRRVKEALLRSGDRVEAGETLLRVEVFEGAERPARDAATSEHEPATAEPAAEKATSQVVSEGPGAPREPIEVFANVEPTTIEREVPPPEPSSPRAALVALLAEGGKDRLYAIVDGSQAIELAMAARVNGQRLFTLFEGDMAVQVAHAGPILIPVEKPSAFLEKWAEALGKSAGILLQTSADLPTLFAQLQHVFVVKDEEGQEYFLRFYDPRVFRGFLPTCTPAERAEFFGCVRRFLVENEAGDAYQAVTLDSFPASGAAG